MKLTEVLELEEIIYAEQEILDALISNNPYIELKEIFPRDFFPKVVRWLAKKLKMKESNRFSYDLKKELEIYLEKARGEDIFNDNAKILTRELLNSIKKWNNYVNKPLDLP
mgnify:CR=1 FL=1